MIDKQIIDGIDVSECGHYHYGKCEIDYDEWNNEIIRYNECQNNPNCVYKQLKRKEQEYNKLKQTLTDIEFWVREFLKRTGQVVPNEIRQILRIISECEVEDAR